MALKRKVFGKVDHHIPIIKEDLGKIQSSYNPSSPDPKSLQQVPWFNIMFHLICRGRENLRLLTRESLAVQVDVAGKKFFYQVVYELDKNHRANDQPHDSPGEDVCMKDLKVSNVQLKLYLSKLNPALCSHACGKDREQRNILAILMKSGIVMCPREKLR